MLGPYTTNRDGTISYRGNKLYPPIKDISKVKFPVKELERRVDSLSKNKMWESLTRINHSINKTVNKYFDELGALFISLPLTTRMISSPGAVYGKKAIKYTTDTCPLTLKWFDLPQKAFLSESSQIYLEMALTPKGINQAYSIYNSFRKEKSDPTHLSEFHHIEYEGKLSQTKNLDVINGLLSKTISNLIVHNQQDLGYFLNNKKIIELQNLSSKKIPQITLKEALKLLYKDTKDKKYKEFTLQNFGFWEETRLTEIVGGITGISEMPLLEVPFYHAAKEGIEPKVADNADIIWPGYRETVGSGHRIRSYEELCKKVKIFQLPKKDYEQYLATRKLPNYQETSGFGLGLERLLQGMLEMPFIWSATHFPRVDKTLKP